MQIIWHGQSFFQIITSQNKNHQATIAIEPFQEDLGLRLPKIEADILLTTRPDHNNVRAVSGSPFLISCPGEYEVKGVFIQGIPAFQDAPQSKEWAGITIYTLEAEELHLCHLGEINQKELTSEQLERIGEVDILMLPVGGNYTLSGKEAVKIMSQIEPKIIIPMHYSLPKLKVKLEGLNGFLKMMGIKKIEPQNKLTIKKKDLSEEEVKIVVLNP